MLFTSIFSFSPFERACIDFQQKIQPKFILTLMLYCLQSATMIKNMNSFFSPYFENISTYYSPCKVLSRNSYGKSDYFNCNFRIRLAAITQFKNDRDKLGRVGPERKWRRSLNTTRQTWLLSYAFGEVWGFARIISSILSWSMRGRRSVVEDCGKESIDESEISIHSSPTSG